MHRLKTPPAIEPVSLAEMRLHIGNGQASDTARDSIISGRITSARLMAEHYTHIALITQTWTYYSDAFDLVIALKEPLQSVTSVKYLDADGVQKTLDPSAYEVDTVSSVLVPAYGASWPGARCMFNSIQVEYICGFGDTAGDVPEPIKDAIRFIVGQWESYQATIEGGIRPMTIPNAAKQLLDPYIDYRGVA